jgi:hypothetical protein
LWSLLERELPASDDRVLLGAQLDGIAADLVVAAESIRLIGSSGDPGRNASSEVSPAIPRQ